MLAVDLVGKRPEVALPHEAGFGVSQPHVVFIVDVLGTHRKVEAGNVVPEEYSGPSHNAAPQLEPALGVDIVQGEIRVTLERAPDGETV